jgi:hypothetical protein
MFIPRRIYREDMTIYEVMDKEKRNRIIASAAKQQVKYVYFEQYDEWRHCASLKNGLTNIPSYMRLQ